MASLKLILSQARRHYLQNSNSQIRSTPILRSLCSLSGSILKPPSNESSTATIKPVSYAVKPKQDPPPSSPDEIIDSSHPQPPPPLQTRVLREPPSDDGPRKWFRDVTPAVSITPVSYPTRVVEVTKGQESVEEEKGEGNVEIRRERRSIEEEKWRRSLRVDAAEEKREVVPFPMLIKTEKKEKSPPMELNDVIRQVKANAKAGFKETVEAHVRLGIDGKRSDLTVRGSVTLPHGTGKVVRVAFFAEGADAVEAKAAGADIVGGVELVEELSSGGKINFDRCYTTPAFMPRLTKIARNLGPLGLMPNPKRGTVTSNVSAAVKEAKQGNIFFRMDKTSIVHVGLGKVNSSEVSLRENICAFVNALLLAKPAGLKKTSKYAGYVNSFHMCSTMGPGFPVSIQSISRAVDDYNKLHLKS